MRKTKHWIAAFAGKTTLLAAFAVSAGTDPFAKPQVDFLPVDEAFELQPMVSRGGAVEVSWRIAKDYYLYRDRLKFSATSPAFKVGAPSLPAAMPHEDEHFGTVQVYRNRLVVVLPVKRVGKGPVGIKVVYQGCADAGLCYPPQTRTLEAGAAEAGTPETGS